jgi:hypothetical protein
MDDFRHHVAWGQHAERLAYGQFLDAAAAVTLDLVTA